MTKIATWNVNSLNIRLPQVIDWLKENPMDALCLQELKLSNDKFPYQALSEIGYHSAVFGQKTYNGVAILTQKPLSNLIYNLPDYPDEQARVLTASLSIDNLPHFNINQNTIETIVENKNNPKDCKNIRIINAYFVNGQSPESDKFSYKLKWLKALEKHVENELKKYAYVILLGDFNITADDRDSFDPALLKDQIHHTIEERQAFSNLINLGLTDAFRLFDQAEKSFSWWDYRELGFRRNRGLRIDYILTSHALEAQIKSCIIDKKPRKNERPSDHTPVILSME